MSGAKQTSSSRTVVVYKKLPTIGHLFKLLRVIPIKLFVFSNCIEWLIFVIHDLLKMHCTCWTGSVLGPALKRSWLENEYCSDTINFWLQFGMAIEAFPLDNRKPRPPIFVGQSIESINRYGLSCLKLMVGMSTESRYIYTSYAEHYLWSVEVMVIHRKCGPSFR